MIQQDQDSKQKFVFLNYKTRNSIFLYILFKIEILINCVSDNQNFKLKIKQIMHNVLLLEDPRL